MAECQLWGPTGPVCVRTMSQRPCPTCPDATEPATAPAQDDHGRRREPCPSRIRSEFSDHRLHTCQHPAGHRGAHRRGGHTWTDAAPGAWRQTPTAPPQEHAAAPTGPGAATDTRDSSQGLSARWRVGRKVPRNLWRETPEHPDGQDIGRMDTAELAAQVVEAVNAQLVSGTPDEPGWDRGEIDSLIQSCDNGGEIGTDVLVDISLGDQLRGLVADRDRLAEHYQHCAWGECTSCTDVARRGDTARAQVDQLERERDALFARGERYRVEAEQARSVVQAVREWRQARRERFTPGVDAFAHHRAALALEAAIDQQQDLPEWEHELLHRLAQQQEDS